MYQSARFFCARAMIFLAQRRDTALFRPDAASAWKFHARYGLGDAKLFCGMSAQCAQYTSCGSAQGAQ